MTEQDGKYHGGRVVILFLVKVGVPVTLSVPDHREVKRGTLRSLVRKAGLSVEEFASLLRS